MNNNIVNIVLKSIGSSSAGRQPHTRLTYYKFYAHCIKAALNKLKTIVQGGCKAFAEDTRTVYDEADHRAG